MSTPFTTSCSESVRLFHALMAAAILATGCESDFGPATAPTLLSQSTRGTASIQPEVLDLSGSWTWSETVTTIFPPFIAEILGIEAEGPVTHAICQDNGTLSLVQTGDTFHGTITQESLCITKGGQQILSPFPPTLEIADGLIRGRSIHFLFGEGCELQGRVSVSGSIAVRMDATGKCEPAVHPALVKTVSWQATR